MNETKQKPDILEKIKRRQEYNREIIKMLSELVECLPDFRFWQLIYLLGYETMPDRFYDESYDTMLQIQQAKNQRIKND